MPKLVAYPLGVLILSLGVVGPLWLSWFIARKFAASYGMSIRWGRLWCVCVPFGLLTGAAGWLYSHYLGTEIPIWANAAAAAVAGFSLAQVLVLIPLFGFRLISNWVLTPAGP